MTEKMDIMLSHEALANVIANGAFGLAAYHLQNSMLTILVRTGHLTMQQASLVFEGAIHEVDAQYPEPSPGDLSSYARAILARSHEGWKSQARGH